MAQHDYVIDNSTGANVRADINSVLQAIASNNSGSSAPSTTYAFQLFANTTTSKLQIRNAANNAFVDLIGLDGSILLADGSASSPSLAFSDDLNTGLFSSAADTLNFTTGGAERMELGATTIFNEDGADVDFRIEGDTEANLFYVDAGNNSVVLGDSAQIGFAVLGIKVDTSSQNGLAFKTSSNGAFGALRGLNAAGTEVCNIQFDTTNSAMNFRTANTTRMSIDSSGNVGIGTTSPSEKLDVEGTIECLNELRSKTGNDLKLNAGSANRDIFLQVNDSTLMTVQGSTGNVGINTTSPSHSLEVNGNISLGNGGSSGGAEMLRIHNDSGVERIHATNNPSALAFGMGGTGSSHERMRIDSSGNVAVGTTTTTHKFSVQNNNTVDPSQLVGFFLAENTNFSGAVLQVGCKRDTSADAYQHFRCAIDGVAIKMQVQNNGDVENTNNNYGSISDESLKENIVDASSQWNDIKNIKVRKFNFKSLTDPNKKTMLGVVAQEAELVCPNLVTTKVSLQEGVEKEYKSFKYSVLYMKAIKCLQEAQEKIETLETKVAALEAA